jgi:hypothetical protein
MLNMSALIEFRTHSGLLVAIGYRRLVIGQRGAYIEFDDEHIEHDKLTVPEDQKYRFHGDWPDKVFYFEYRTTDESNVMVYHQNQYVGYADYKPGMYYIAPSDLEWGGAKLSTEEPPEPQDGADEWWTQND